MNWSKAKNILIVVLIVTNIVLLGIFFLDRRRVFVYENSDKFASQAKSLLKEKGIEVLVDIPTKEVVLPSLDVSYESFSTEDLNQRFFDKKGLIEKDDSNQVVIKKSNSLISLIDKRRLLYEHEFDAEDLNLTLVEADQVAMNFLTSKGYSTQDLELVRNERFDGGWELVYTMVYKGYYVESTHTSFRIKGDQVAQMDRLWIEVVGEEGSKQVLEPASKAILSLLGKGNLTGSKIRDISPCYFFNPEEQGAVEELTRSLEGKSSGTWRAVLDSGEEVILMD